MNEGVLSLNHAAGRFNTRDFLNWTDVRPSLALERTVRTHDAHPVVHRRTVAGLVRNSNLPRAEIHGLVQGSARFRFHCLSASAWQSRLGDFS